MSATKVQSLGGVNISFAGPLIGMAESDYCELIRQNGGKITQEVQNGQTTHLITSIEAEALYTNEYKMQWFPQLRSQIEKARSLNLPIVSEEWLNKCIERGRREKEAPFLLFLPKTSTTTATRAQEAPQSTLDPRIQELVALLFDENELEKSLTSMGLDAKKLLSTAGSVSSAISEAYGILSELDTLVHSTPPLFDRIRELSSRFYKLIPRTDQSSSAQQINSSEAVKKELKVLEAIRDVDIAAELLKRGKTTDIDAKYGLLHTKMEPIEKHTSEFALIQQYVENTHAHIHSGFSLEVSQLFKISRDGENERFLPFERLPNHRLLWHGSRFSNFVGILTQGLRVAPPEAPITGYFLGKGIYFADMSSKSAEYIHATPENNTGLLILCEVALGRWFQIAHGKYISKEDLDNAGFHSTKGCGELAPDPSFDFSSSDGYVIPLGHESDTGVLCSELQHNEFIVYDPAQVKMRYLLRVNFTFHDSHTQIS